MTQIPKNPFDREDWFSEVVKSNDSIMNSSQKAFLQFQTKHNPQSMTKFQKLLTFFTTHTITAVVTASICLGGIATFAAQQVAPEQYKPSTVVSNLFKNNKVQQTNPNTPLVSDAQNDVVSYDPCNISIKYPKQLAGEKIIAVKPQDYNQPGENTIPDYYGVTIMSQKSFNYDTSSNIQGNVGFSCSKEFISPADNNLNSTMTSQELADLTGWFITGEQKLEEIRTENQNTAGPFRTVYFKFNDFYYRIDFTTKKITANILNSQPEDVKTFWNNAITKPGIFGDQIQIQFNNKAKNIPNVEIQNVNGVPTSGENFKYDVELTTSAVGNYWELTDSKTGDKYIIKGDELNQKAEKLSNSPNNLQISSDKSTNNVRSSGGGNYIFSGKVKNEDGIINTPDTFLITGIDKFELNQKESKGNLSISSLKSKLGKIYGTLSYPSEGLPGVDVCAENMQNKKLICTKKVTGGWDSKPVDLNYSLELPTGEYEVYSTAEPLNNFKAYYDEYSVCSGRTINDNCYEQYPNPKPVKVYIAEGSQKELSGWNWWNTPKNNNNFNTAPISPDGSTSIYGGGVPVRTDTVGGIIRSSGPDTEEKNGMIIQGELFVPKSQSVKATESIDEYSPLSCDIVPLKSYANNSNGMLFLTNAKNYTANGIGSDNSTPLRLNQLKEYISTGKGEISNAINAFRSGCGGFATESMKELGYTNKNGRQIRTVLVATGQEAIGDPNIYTFILQGDKLAMLTTTVYTNTFEKCNGFGYSSTNPNLPRYQNCMQDLMKNNSEVEKFAREKMQELLSSFEID
jgi:hypothetical protein